MLPLTWHGRWKWSAPSGGTIEISTLARNQTPIETMVVDVARMAAIFLGTDKARKLAERGYRIGEANRPKLAARDAEGK